eukprot:m51a1_g11487 hypothetical protein (382) ;mRNA; f:10227-14366
MADGTACASCFHVSSLLPRLPGSIVRLVDAFAFLEAKLNKTGRFSLWHGTHIILKLGADGAEDPSSHGMIEGFTLHIADHSQRNYTTIGLAKVDEDQGTMYLLAEALEFGTFLRHFLPNQPLRVRGCDYPVLPIAVLDWHCIIAVHGGMSSAKCTSDVAPSGTPGLHPDQCVLQSVFGSLTVVYDPAHGLARVLSNVLTGILHWMPIAGLDASWQTYFKYVVTGTTSLVSYNSQANTFKVDMCGVKKWIATHRRVAVVDVFRIYMPQRMVQSLDWTERCVVPEPVALVVDAALAAIEHWHDLVYSTTARSGPELVAEWEVCRCPVVTLLHAMRVFEKPSVHYMTRHEFCDFEDFGELGALINEGVEGMNKVYKKDMRLDGD